MTTTRTITVTGATGFVGRHLVRQLLGRGNTVRAFVRDRTKATAVLGCHETLELIVGDCLEENDCLAATDGSDACIHLVGTLREHGSATYERIHTAATRHMVAACQSSGTSRYIQMSALGASPMSQAAYLRTKFDAERAVRNSALDWTILRPGLIHGQGGDFTKMAAHWARGTKPPHFFMPYFTRTETDESGRHTVIPQVQPVFVEDVAKAAADALDCDEAIGEIIPLAGAQSLDFADMLRTIRDALPDLGPRLAAVGIPGQLAAMKAHMAEMAGAGALLPFNTSMAIMAQQDSTADLTKARAMLNFNPAGFTDALASYAAVL
jgi:uncharacterized protein YbjT (DUF2867 family)